ncbi:MAG: SSS family solute:Na+ symporter [Psychromonas sp.]|jgi:SSS family solute:Na+ symporter|uniref:sodium:solute symporter family protein n=1 Tax=Psychromonas sp. TaxID=1884585 RepID=UPI0039E30F30
MQYSIIIAVFIYEIVVIAGVAWFLSRKKQKHADGDFALGGRSLPTSVVAVTLALTVLGTAHILGVFEMTWSMGASAVWFSIAHVILLVVVCASTGLWVRRLGVSTVPQILEMFYGRNTRLLVSCVMAGVIFGILTIETQGLGIIISSMTGWEIKNGAIVGGMIGVLYVVLAGIKEVGWVNLVNAVVMYIGLVLATIVLAFKLPGGSYESVSNFYTDSGNGFMLSIYGTPEILLTFGLGTVVAVVFSQGINQMLLQPAMAARDEKTIKRALWIAAPLNGLFGVFAVVIGLTAKSIPEFEVLGPKVAATTMLVNLLPGWLSALLLASFLAAILSTFAMTSLSPATIFTMDIYKRLYRQNASDAELTRVIRITIVVLAIIAMAVASFLPPILASMNWLFSWLVPIFWVVVFGFIWKRHATAAVLTLVSAWIANSLWSFSSLPEALNMAGTPNAYVTLGVTLFVGVLSNLILPGETGYFKSTDYDDRLAQMKQE